IGTEDQAARRRPGRGRMKEPKQFRQAQRWTKPSGNCAQVMKGRGVMNSEKSPQVGVIGGGLGGLASACTLAARGYDVALFEKNDWLGGKVAVLRDAGFRFDMGPTILLCPRCSGEFSPKPDAT